MKLYTKKGKLTSYALHCGYIAWVNGYSLQVQFNQYVVKGYNLEDIYFETITEARKYINSL